MFSVSLLPALALASVVPLPPPATIHNLGAPPATHNSELFDGTPSHLGPIVDADRYFNAYSLTLSANSAYSFVVGGLNSQDLEFDVFFLITDHIGTVLISSEVAHNTESGLELRLVAPASGTFHLVVSSVAGVEVGEYGITVTPIPNFGEITGTVQNGGGQTLEDILVTAYRQRVGAQGIEYIAELSTMTEADGSFNLRPLIPGIYRVSFRDLNFVYGHSYYFNHDTLEDANSMAVAANASLALSTVTLTEAAAITGIVACELNLPLEGIMVTAHTRVQDNTFSVASADTDASGNFAITGLTAGTYYVSFTCPYGFFFTQYFNNVGSIDDATPLHLTTSDTFDQANAALIPTATVSGTVNNSANNPVEDIVVSLLRLRDSTRTPYSQDCFEVIEQTVTGDDGTYFFGRLVAGSYFLHFSDLEARFLDLYYANAFIPARASPLIVGDRQHLANRNVTLTHTASLSGTVSDTELNYLSGILVRLFNLESAPNPITPEFLTTPSFETYTDDSGNFQLTNVSPGNYLLEFSDSTGRHITLYHFDQLDPNTAHTVTITPGTHLTGHNASLSPAARITGTVIEEISGLTLAGAQVFLFEDSSSQTPFLTTETSEDGSFAFRGLAQGDYYLGFVPSGYDLESMQFFYRSYQITEAASISLDRGEFLDLDHLAWMPLPTVALTLERENNTAAQRITITQGSTLEVLPTPSFWGHRFEGWFTAPQAGTRVEAPLTLDDDLTLFAQWRAADFIFDFDSRGGSAVEDHFFYFGDVVGILPVPMRAGYEFTGWFDRPLGGFPLLPNAPVERSQTLYAQWRVSTHTITFDAQAGSYVSSQYLEFGQNLGALPTPHKPFHTFDGWYLTPSGATSRIQSDFVITHDTTLYARWSVERITVRLETRGGRGLAARTQDAGTVLGVLPTPRHPDRTFVGWTLDSAGTRPARETTIATQDMTLFAQWRVNDARGAALSRSAGILNNPFSPDRFTYRLDLRATTSSVRITFIPKDSRATVLMRTSSNQSFEQRTSIRISLGRGQSRTLEIRVNSPCGQRSQTYRVLVRRAWY